MNAAILTEKGQACILAPIRIRFERLVDLQTNGNIPVPPPSESTCVLPAGMLPFAETLPQRHHPVRPEA